VDHIRYIADRIGIERVALGSDFDGTTVPNELKDAAGLPRLIELMRQNGFDQISIERVAYRNWLDVLARTWGN